MDGFTFGGTAGVIGSDIIDDDNNQEAEIERLTSDVEDLRNILIIISIRNGAFFTDNGKEYDSYDLGEMSKDEIVALYLENYNDIKKISDRGAPTYVAPVL